MTTNQEANSAHPAEICGVYLTEPQRVLLRGLVVRAAQDDNDRVRRMNARPPGSHSPAKLAEAARDRDDLAAIEAAIESAIEAAPSRKLASTSTKGER